MSSTRVRVDKDVPLFKELFNIDDRYSDMSPLVLVRQGLHCPHTPPTYRPFCLSVSVSVSLCLSLLDHVSLRFHGGLFARLRVAALGLGLVQARDVSERRIARVAI